MPATYTDRLQGLTTSVAVKAPCRVATTTNIQLKGLQVVDGVSLSAADRVLVKDQSDSRENGVWMANGWDWSRALDFDGTRDAVGGTQVLVIEGATNGSTYWRTTGEGQVNIGTDAIDFIASTVSDSSTVSFLQAGANAVVRPVQDKSRDLINVKDFEGADIDARWAATLANARANGGGTFRLPDAASYAPTAALPIVGEFTNGVYSDGGGAVVAPASGSVDGQFIGNTVGNIAASYFNKFRMRNYVLTGSSKSAGASGLHLQATADNSFQNYRIRGFQCGIFLDGGLTSSFIDMTVRNNAVGVKAQAFTDGAGGLNDFASNANSFFGLRVMYNDVAIDYDYNPSSVINWFGGNVEANNEGGSAADGVKVVKLSQAGHHNFIGVHSEANKGQYGIHYTGFDTSKTLLLAGCEVIDAVDTNLHMAQGRLTAIASRITNNASTNDIFFAAGTTGTLIDTEGVLSGDLSHVVSIRDGKIAFGAHPDKTSSGAMISMGSEAIAAASNVAASFRNDTIQIRFRNTANTSVGYIQTTASGDHTISNDSAGGGWLFRAGNTSRFYVGRVGGMSIEPGADNTITCGSASFRFSTVYASTGSINTSDERSKQQVRDLSAAEQAVALRCKALIRAFKFNDSVDLKGDGARWHFGVIAQDVEEAFTAEGLSAANYGLFCYDKWDEQLDGDGNVIAPAGDRYGVRYEELLAFVVSAL